MKRSIAVVAVLLSASIAQAAPLRLADAIELAVAHGPDGAAARALIPIARAEVRSAGMLANPTLGVAVARSEPIVAANLAVRLPIFGQRGAHVRAAERAVDQTEAEVRAVVWRLRRDARVAYYAVARSDEEVAIAVVIERLTRDVSDKARERFEVGMGTRLDQAEADLIHTRALQEISDRRAAARVARLELGRLCGLPVEQIDALADPLDRFADAPVLPSLLAEAARHHPELAAFLAEEEAARARAAAGRADIRPVPVVEVGIELLDPATCNAAAPAGHCVGPRGGLAFDLPIFNWNGGPIAVAEAEARAAEAKRAAAASRILAAVRSAHETLIAATVRARFFDADYLPSAQLVVTMAREGFQSGKTGLLPLIEAERAELEARLGRAEALFAVQVARADLEQSSGVVAF